MTAEQVTVPDSVTAPVDTGVTLPATGATSTAVTQSVVSGTVTLSGQSYPFRRWAGERLLPNDLYIAFDTETEVVADLDREVPRLALATVSAGPDASVLIHPDDIGRFVHTHRGLRWVCFNTAFDFWVVEQHL